MKYKIFKNLFVENLNRYDLAIINYNQLEVVILTQPIETMDRNFYAVNNINFLKASEL